MFVLQLVFGYYCSFFEAKYLTENFYKTMRIKSFLIILLLSFFTVATANSQDTLFFQRKGEPSRLYNIPFNQFLVHVKLHNGEERKALVSGVIDSSVVFKVWDDSWLKRRKKRKVLYEIYADKKNNIAKKDSLSALMPYAYLDTIKVSEIKSIFLITSDRQNMRKFYNGLAVFGWTAVALEFTAILIESRQLYITALIMILADGVVANSAAFRTIQMKKWQIKL